MKRVGNSQLDQHSLQFGEHRVTLYKRGDATDSSWFFRIHLTDEDRFYRKSLKTKDKDEAAKRAQTELIGLLAKQQSGQRVLAISLPELQKRFYEHCASMVVQGQLAPKTWINHKMRINRGIEFLAKHYPPETKVSAIDGSVFDHYLTWRFETNAAKGRTLRRDVCRDELLIIRKMFKWGHEEGLLPPNAVPKWNFVVEKDAPKRQRMGVKDYTNFLKTIYFWIQDSRNERETYNRILLRHFVLVVSNSGMRSGELFGLKNRDVQINKRAGECLLNIRAETSKVRQSRQISFHGSYSGNPRKPPVNYLIRWIEEYQKHKEPGDYVFAPLESGSTQARDVYYHNYKLLRVRLKEHGIEWFDTYHCRHFWVTNRLLAGEPIHLVARAAGTSVSEIESTYSHVLGEMATRGFSRRIVEYDADGGYRIVMLDEKQNKPEKKKAAKKS